MGEIALNILDPEEILRLKAVLSEVVLALPEQQRSCEVQASVAEQLLKLAAGGEKDPIRLKEHALSAMKSQRAQELDNLRSALAKFALRLDALEKRLKDRQTNTRFNLTELAKPGTPLAQPLSVGSKRRQRSDPANDQTPANTTKSAAGTGSAEA